MNIRIMGRHFLSVLAVSTLITALFTVSADAENSISYTGSTGNETLLVIKLPAIPAHLKDPSERADYLITHYWDNVDFSMSDPGIETPSIEQGFVDFIDLLPYASGVNTREEGMEALIKRAASEPQILKSLTDLADKYLYNSNSPLRSEEYYLMYLKALSASETITQTEKVRTDDRIEMIGKNFPGSIATDFPFVLPDGKETSLREYQGGKGNIILIFFDPECENCHEVIARMSTDVNLKKETKEGKTSVLAIYPGENKEAWEKTLPLLPANWTVGMNEGGIEEDDLYYFPEMPTIYLLDSEGIVKARDLQW